MSYLRRFSPPWPVVPPLLWGTLAAVVLAGLNLIFQDEIWLGSEKKQLSVHFLWLLLVLTGPQMAQLLWRWPAPPDAPNWWQLLFWLSTRCAALAGTALSLVLGVLLLCFW